MKIQLNKKYIEIAVYVILTAAFIIASYFVIRDFERLISVSMNFFQTTVLLFSPLIIGLILAYLLEPLVAFYHRKVSEKLPFPKKKTSSNPSSRRLLATALAFLTVFGVLFIAVFAASSSFRSSRNIGGLDESILALETFVTNFSQITQYTQDRLAEIGFLEQGDDLFERIAGVTTVLVNSIGNYLVVFLTKLASYLLNIFIGMILGFYLLMDKTTLLKGWNRFIRAITTPKIYKRLHSVWHEADWILSGYFRGQILDVLIMTFLISLALIILGVDYAVIIGVISGIANIVPMLGSTLATVLAVTVALAGDNPITALYALIVLIILQQIDGNIIVPKVVGDNVKLNPLLVILSIFVFGSLYGILGMVVAVPLTALGKLFLMRFIDHRLKGQELT